MCFRERREAASREAQAAASAKWAAEARVEDANAALVTAEREDGYYLHRLMRGGADATLRVPEAQTAVAEAEAQLVSAQARHEAARKAHEAFERAAGAPLGQVKGDTRDFAAAVVRAEAGPAAQAAAEQAKRAYEEFVRHAPAVLWFARMQVYSVSTEHGTNHGRPADPALRDVLRLVENLRERAMVPEALFQGGPWEAALAALQADADAPLPAVE